jgi:hypothetical protein
VRIQRVLEIQANFLRRIATATHPATSGE